MTVWWCAIDYNQGYATYDELKARNVVAQGWEDLGNLLRLGEITESKISQLVDRYNEGRPEKEHAPSDTFKNLLNRIRRGDLVVGIEGQQVKGICKILAETRYIFNSADNFETVNNGTLALHSKTANGVFTGFNYPHCLYPVKWVDWTTIDSNWAPGAPGQGVKGIRRLQQAAPDVETRWNTYEAGLTGTLPWAGQWLQERLKRRRELERQLEMTEIDDAFGVARQIILHGPPGTGKTFKARRMAAQLLGLDEEGREFKQARFGDRGNQSGSWEIVQFHPSYNYEDFVRGIRSEVNVSGNVEYRVIDRIFAEMCQAAIKEDTSKHVLIIDEINRSNLAAVMGELLFALEYRGESVRTLYTVSGGTSELIVPPNLYVIGTMNTADRSLGHLDYAMRRRFVFLHCPAETEPIGQYYETRDSRLGDFAMAMFGRVASLFEGGEALVSPDYRSDDVKIGHTYFMANSESELRAKFKYQVLPLLDEYVADGVLRAGAGQKIAALRVEYA